MNNEVIIGTIASHSALNILSGAQAEGYKTVLFTKPDRIAFYKSFHIADEIIQVSNYQNDILDNPIYSDNNLILIPHGSFVAYLSLEKLLKSKIPLFGTRKLLYWESDRKLKSKLMLDAGLKVPHEFSSIEEVKDSPVIVKFDGAEGGRGYFVAKNQKELIDKLSLKGLDPKKSHFQEFVVGTKIYVQFFYSPLHRELETFGVDLRYETDVDSRIRFDNEYSFQIVGYVPAVLRESLLLEYYKMGLQFVESTEKNLEQPMIGPFCLETIVDRNLNIYCFEFSGRIVAGTNLFIPSSPYSYIMHRKDVWMGRRIAMEIKEAVEKDRLSEVLL